MTNADGLCMKQGQQDEDTGPHGGPALGEKVLRHAVSLGLVLIVVWALLSGHTEPLIIGFGVLSVVLVIWIGRRMDVVDHEAHSVNLTWHVLTYWPWLIWQIVKANRDVVKVILSGGAVSPVMFKVRAAQQSAPLQVTFANSITLTPGTVTVGMNDGVLTVHALTAAGAEDLMDNADGTPSDMNRLCRELEARADRGGAAA